LTIYLCERCGYWSRHRQCILRHFDTVHAGPSPVAVEDLGVLRDPAAAARRAAWQWEAAEILGDGAFEVSDRRPGPRQSAATRSGATPASPALDAQIIELNPVVA
jgi:hypothetical protein